MARLTGIVWLYIFLLSAAMADSLDIKVNQDHINLPYFAAQVGPQYGAVVLVRGGEHPQWSPLLAHFAEQLSHYGWSVVLLNCIEAPTPWVSQIPKAISALRQKNNTRIILVHYGDQLSQSIEYFSRPQSKMINGLIMISAYDTKIIPHNPPKLRFPLFDIAGQFDFTQVLNQRTLRRQEYKQSNYATLDMPGAHHDYEYSQKLLLAFVHGWMSKLPAFEIHAPPVLVSYIEPVVSLPSFIVAI